MNATEELVKKLTDATEYGDVGPEGYETIWLPTALEIVRAAVPDIQAEAIEAYEKSLFAQMAALQIAIGELVVGVLGAVLAAFTPKKKTRGW